MNLLPVAASRQSAASFGKGSLRRSAETPLRFMRRVRVRVFRLWFLTALLGLPFFSFTLSAQTPPPRELPSRFLFIVDTSAAMRRRAPATQKAIERLMRTGLSGQLRPDDTVGVWTFDEELYAGRFPLQRWSRETSESVASNVVAFLKAQPYQKKSRFDVVVPALERIVKSSNKLTILLVTDGDGKISGTPFDREIQTALERHFKMQQKAREPFITVLRASRGQFINATVNLMPWPVEFPAFPPEPALVEAPKPKPPEPKPAPRPPIPSLIVIGKKPELTAVTNTPAATNVIELAAAATNAPVQVETTNPAITPTPPQLNPSEIKATPAPIPTSTPAEVVTKPAEPVTLNPSTNAPPTVAIGSAPIAPPVKPVPIPIVETKPAPAPVSEPVQLPPATTLIEPAPPANSPEARSPALANSPTNEGAPPNQPTPVALAILPEPGFSRMGMIAFGVALVLLAGGLFFVRQRRARHAAHASLITRSMERDRR